MNADAPSGACRSDDGSVDSLMLALARVPPLAPAAVSALGGGDALRPGRVLGQRYELLELLGRGGMGTVYAARNLRTGREVAVKVLHPGPPAGTARGEREARFTREARAAGRVRHRNVVDVYDVDVDGDLLYLVMERLHGESLRARIARGPLAPRSAVAILIDAMRGVAAAHRQGVIHRDLKPDNIFLAHAAESSAGAPQLTVKVLDFGVSRIVENDQPEPSPLTGEGQVLGTVSYMPPEQLRGEAQIDARSDVYALGVILYEAVSGVRPYRGKNERELLARIFSEPPASLCARAPAADARLEALTMRALARDPAERHASVESFADALTDWLQEGACAPSARAAGGRWTVALTASLVLVALACVAWLVLGEAPARQRPASASGAQGTHGAPAAGAKAPPSTVQAKPAPQLAARPAVPAAAAHAAPSGVQPKLHAARARPGRAPRDRARAVAAPSAAPAAIDDVRRETLLLPGDF